MVARAPVFQCYFLGPSHRSPAAAKRRTSPRRRWLLRTRARRLRRRQVELEAFALLEDTSRFAVRQELALLEVGEGAAAQRVEDVGLEVMVALFRQEA